MRTQWVNGISVEIKQIGGLIWLLWSAFPSSPFRLVSDCLGVSTTNQEINGLKGEVHHLHQRSFRKNRLQVFCPGCNQNVTVSMSGSDRSDHVIGENHYLLVSKYIKILSLTHPHQSKKRFKMIQFFNIFQWISLVLFLHLFLPCSC